MIPRVPLRRALEDPALLGNVLAGDSWRVWKILLIATLGEELTEDERVIFTKFTGRERELGQRVDELALVAGRRGGKSRSLGVLATYSSALCNHTLAPGERGVVLLAAPDQRQAGILLNYIAANFEQSPILNQLVERKTRDAIDLTNGVSIEVRAADFRRLRGPTYVAVIADEVAFFYSEETSSNADAEIINAVRPGLATTSGLLVLSSSPHARRGELWEVYRKHYGKDGDPLILVAQGASREFNPSLPQHVVDRALDRDHAKASAEYLAQFRTDLEAFVSRDVVEACMGEHVEALPIERIKYYGFVDPSGGSADAFTLAISHKEGERCFVDCIREIRPPFSPEAVVEEFSALLKSYRVTTVQGDRYAGEWPREQFRKRGITYKTADKNKSDLFRDLLPMLNAGQIVLPKSERLLGQLCGLERRVSRGGKDSIDHAPGQHDDLANAVAGAAFPISKPVVRPMPVFGVQSANGKWWIDFRTGRPLPESGVKLNESDIHYEGPITSGPLAGAYVSNR